MFHNSCDSKLSFSKYFNCKFCANNNLFLKLQKQTVFGSEECGPELSLLTLVQMDEYPENKEKIGCYLKCQITDHAEFYNGTFHIEEGFFENIMAHLTGDCFNTIEDNDFGCNHFYKIWTCFKGYLIKSKEAVDAISKSVTLCKPVPEKKITKKLYQCVPKCVLDKLGFVGVDKFDPSIMSSWLKNHFTPKVGDLFTNVVNVCHNKTNLRYSGEISYDCKYFYKFFKCNIVELLRGVLELGDKVPQIKGFTFDL